MYRPASARAAAAPEIGVHNMMDIHVDEIAQENNDSDTIFTMVHANRKTPKISIHTMSICMHMCVYELASARIAAASEISIPIYMDK